MRSEKGERRKKNRKKPQVDTRNVIGISIISENPDVPEYTYPNAEIIVEIPSEVIDALDLYVNQLELQQKLKENNPDVDSEDILESSLELALEVLTSDEEIVEKTTENSPQADPKEKPVVFLYKNNQDTMRKYKDSVYYGKGNYGYGHGGDWAKPGDTLVLDGHDGWKIRQSN